MRRRSAPERGPVRPPRRLVDPKVADFARRGERPTGPGMSPMDRKPDESDAAWAWRQVADQRYHEELATWLAEHRGRRLDLTVEERRRWLLGEGPSW